MAVEKLKTASPDGPAEAARRRRWPWIVLAAALLLGGGLVAQRFWPLSPDERRLLGTWVLPVPSLSGTEETRITFTSDRRFFRSGSDDPQVSGLPALGAWSCADGVLSLGEAPPPRRFHWSIVKAYWNRLLKGPRTASQRVDFESRDRVRLGGRLWTRGSPPAVDR